MEFLKHLEKLSRTSYGITLEGTSGETLGIVIDGINEYIPRIVNALWRESRKKSETNTIQIKDSFYFLLFVNLNFYLFFTHMFKAVMTLKILEFLGKLSRNSRNGS